MEELDWTCLNCYGENKSEHNPNTNDIDQLIECQDCGQQWTWADIFEFGLNF